MIEILSQKIKRNYILINAKPLTGQKAAIMVSNLTLTAAFALSAVEFCKYLDLH